MSNTQQLTKLKTQLLFLLLETQPKPGTVAHTSNFSTLGGRGRGGLLEARPRVQDQPDQHSKTLSLKIYFGVCPSSLSWNYINLCNMYIIYSTYTVFIYDDDNDVLQPGESIRKRQETFIHIHRTLVELCAKTVSSFLLGPWSKWLHYFSISTGTVVLLGTQQVRKKCLQVNEWLLLSWFVCQ